MISVILLKHPWKFHLAVSMWVRKLNKYVRDPSQTTSWHKWRWHIIIISINVYRVSYRTGQWKHRDLYSLRFFVRGGHFKRGISLFFSKNNWHAWFHFKDYDVYLVCNFQKKFRSKSKQCFRPLRFSPNFWDPIYSP